MTPPVIETSASATTAPWFRESSSTTAITTSNEAILEGISIVNTLDPETPGRSGSNATSPSFALALGRQSPLFRLVCPIPYRAIVSDLASASLGSLLDFPPERADGGDRQLSPIRLFGVPGQGPTIRRRFFRTPNLGEAPKERTQVGHG